MNVSLIADKVIHFLSGPTGWVALVVFLVLGFFLMRGNPTK